MDFNIGETIYTVSIASKTYRCPVRIIRRKIDGITINKYGIMIESCSRTFSLDEVFKNYTDALLRASELSTSMKEETGIIENSTDLETVLRKVKSTPEETVYECAICGKQHYWSWTPDHIEIGDKCTCGATVKEFKQY